MTKPFPLSFLLLSIVLLSVSSLSYSQTVDFTGTLDNMAFEAKIAYKPDCYFNSEAVVQVGLHSVYITSYTYNGRVFRGNDLKEVTFPIAVEDGFLKLSARVRVDVRTYIDLPEKQLSINWGMGGPDIMKDNFTVPKEELKAIGVGQCQEWIPRAHEISGLTVSSGNFAPKDHFSWGSKLMDLAKKVMNDNGGGAGNSDLSENTNNNSNSENPSFNNYQEFQEYQSQQQNKGSENEKSDLEKENERRRFHQDHVNKVNQGKENNNQPNSSDQRQDLNTRNQTQNQVTPEHQAYADRKQAQWDNDFQRIQRKLNENREKQRRLEASFDYNLQGLSNFIQNMPKVTVSVSSISSAETPQQAYANFQSTLNALDNMLEQSNQNLYKYLAKKSYSSPGSQEEAMGDLGTAIGAAGATAIKNAEIKRQQRAAEAAYRRQADKFRKELEAVYQKNQNATAYQHAFAVDKDVEEYFLKLNQYWTCNLKHLDKAFSYTYVGWAKPSSNCYQPSAVSAKSRFNAKDYLKAAKRKKAIYDKYGGENYLTASKYFLNKSIELDQSNAEAYAFRADFYDSPVDQYAQALAAYKMDNHSEYVREVKQLKETAFISALFYAIETGNASFVNTAINSGFHRGKSFGGETPLIAAVNADQPTCFDLLYIDYFKGGNGNQNQYLIMAAEKNSVNVAKYLVNERKADPAVRINGISPLEVSYANNSTEVFAFFLKEKADLSSLMTRLNDLPEQKKNLAEMMFDAAKINDDIELFRKAIAYHKPSDAKMKELMFSSITLGRQEIVETLVKEFSLKNAEGSDGQTYLHMAVIHDQPEILKFFIEENFNSNVFNKNGLPASHYLLNIPSKIMSSGVYAMLDLNAKDKAGVALLHKAVFAVNNYKLIKGILESKKADVNIKGLYGWTPLHYAARENDMSICRLLLGNGANKELEDQWGRTPEKIAKERGFKIVKVVLK